jgi:O-antigen ligase
MTASRLPIFGEALRVARSHPVATPRVVAGVLLTWWAVHLTALLYSTPDLKGALAATDTGSLLNQLQIGLLAAIGLPVIVPALRAMKRTGATWQYWFLAYLSWSALTLTWSISPELGIRRFIALVCISIGAIGIGGGYYGDNYTGPFSLFHHLRVAGIFALLACIPALASELSMQNLFDAAWKTSLRQYGPEIGFAVAYAAVASFAGRTMWQKRQALPAWAVLAALFTMLLLLKSRALIAVTSIVISVVYLQTRKTTPLFTAVLIIALALGLLAAFVTTIAIPDLPSKILPYYARGEDDTTLDQINGRLPLWSYIWYQAIDQPWTGVGFGSYWTPQRLSAVWNAIGWQAPSAHNGYLDEFAQTGIIGVGLFILFCLAAIRDIGRRSRSLLRVPAVITLGWFAIFLLINVFDSILQVYFRVSF